MKKLGVIVIWLLIGTVISAQDWTRWRGDRQNGSTVSDGHFKFQEGMGLETVWKSKFGVAYSSISVQGNRAVTMTSDGTTDFVWCFDTETKKEIWKYSIGPAYKSIGPDHDGPNSTPTLVGDVMFGLGANGYLFALNMKDGSEIWKKHLTKDFGSNAPEYGFTTSPLYADGVLIVQTGRPGKVVSGLDPKNGKELWSMGEADIKFQSPVYMELAGVKQVVGSGDKKAFGFDAKSGKLYWEYAFSGQHQSNTPLKIGKDKVYLRVSNRESALLQISRHGDSFKVDELWKIDQGSGSLATPIHYDGYIYNYSRRFLACIDVANGELKWKSRPPGEGFLINVDDQIVVLTRRGMLHVIKASPDGYQPLTQLKVLDEIVWTPPSYGAGQVFCRSIAEIAAVKMNRGVQVVAKDQEPDAPLPRMQIPDSEFGRFIAKLEKSKDKQSMLNSFMKGRTSPYYEGSDLVHILYRGEAKDLVILGDMLEWGVEAPMNRVAGTDFFYASFRLPADARLNYFLIRDFDHRITDPLNPSVVPSVVGDCSQIAMPAFKAPLYLQEPTDIKKGTLVDIELQGEIFEEPRKAKVYLPAGYETSQDRFPVVYVNHGDAAIQMGKMVNTLDNLIGSELDPMIAVFLIAPNSGREYARVGRDRHADMVCKEMVPFIDQKFRTKSDASHRAFMGGDEGGYAAIYAALKHPGLFGKVAGQSTHLMPTAGGNELVALIDGAKTIPFEIYLDWGRFDYRNDNRGFNWISYNEDLVKRLNAKGAKVQTQVTNQGWGWVNWRNRTAAILKFFFPPRAG